MKPLLLILSLSCLPIRLSAEWINFVVNYSRSEYGAGSQNWKIARQWNGKMYFANKSGILEYTGEAWKLYRLNNESATRCVYRSKDNKLYAGGMNEFGYLEPSSNGELKYRNLSASLPKGRLTFGNVWNIHETSDDMLFCGDKQIVKYRDSSFTFVDCPYKIDCSFMLDETLYAGTVSGIYILSGSKFIKYPGSELVEGKKLRGIIKVGDKSIVATSDGLYLPDDKFSRLKTEADKFMIDNELFCIAANDKYMAIGTILEGIVILDHAGRVIKYMNESHGLQNNTILSLFFDDEDNLWVGLDNGIDYISLNNAITELYRSPNSYGAGYSAALFDGKLYLATNRGLYSIEYPIPINELAPTLASVPGMQGQVWDINVIDNKLYCSSDKGLFIFDSEKLTKIQGIDNNWTCKKMLRDSSKFWLPSYFGIYTMDAKSLSISKIDGCLNSFPDFEEDNLGRIWAKNENNELVILTFNDSVTRLFSSETYNRDKGLPLNAKCGKFVDRVLLFSPYGTYGIENNDFAALEIRGIPLDCISKAETDGKIWSVGQSVLNAYNRKTQENRTYLHNLPLMTNFERIEPIDDSLAIIMNENGFALWNSEYERKDSCTKLQILDVTVTKPKDSVIYLNNSINGKYIPEIPYLNNSLVFHYRLNSYNPAFSPTYRYRLDDDEWTQTTSKTKMLNDIPAGKHVFYVECLSYSGRKLSDKFSFTILAPWYSTTYAYVAYLILTIFVIVILNHVDNLRLKRKRKHLETIQRREMQNRETAFKAETEAKEKLFMMEKEEREREIIRLKNERLELEIKHKSQELANITINFLRKNEILMEIRQNIAKYSDELRNMEATTGIRRNLIRLANRIGENMEQDDGLKRFEEHFDVVHNNFMQRLSEKYPDLSLNERKMCAFIKMNLSTKEIVPLINLSMRGVESMRFRLRKKFGLNRNESLLKFLNGM